MKTWIINGEEYTDVYEAASYISDYMDEEQYDNMLDEIYGDIDICGYEYAASIAFERVDPTAYRVGFSDYTSSVIDDIEYDLDNMEDGDVQNIYGTEVECIDLGEYDEGDVNSSRSLRGSRSIHANTATRRPSQRKIIQAEMRVMNPRYSNQKSFYGKAKVDEMTGGSKVLYSYGTKAAEVTADDQAIVYNVQSQTTLRHVKDFLRQEGFSVGTKQQILKEYGV